ncbi:MULTISPECIES: hypothetical protein [unclassified Zunongwangia]|uniref:hypothetical protein n=1 Tax=unclassified Zunongwangia TaxID=2632541 RepID=UPI0022DD01E8|nr:MULTISPECIES: hypothetical protein [unclassified Zunongwangia]WBL22517.1 hypothetical protein PBT89_00830 [Zunongwangia sp. HRR-M8]WBL25533.1 hypothetical protein PBT91_16760 [Zunongwangia sp. HGR-M22]
MYQTVQFIHSYWAYLVVIMLTVAAVSAIIGWVSGKEYSAGNFRISLFTLIVSHIQLLIGIVLYFTAPYFKMWGEVGMSGVMADDTLRLYNMEHPLMMIIAIVLITVGYSKHKKKLTSTPKFKTLAIFYTIALLVLLSRIPWNAWLS